MITTKPKQSFSSPLALGLLASMPTARDPVDAILLNANTLRIEAGLREPPFSPACYAELRRVENIIDREMAVDGRLVSRGRTFIVELRKDRSVERKNFTCAHEVAHTFFYEAVPLLKYCSHESAKPQYDPEEEMLCDIAAAELLMPRKVFRKMASDHLPSPQSALQLAQTFRTSLTATIIRLLSLEVWNAAFVMWETRTDRLEARWLTRRDGKLRYDPSLEIMNPKSSGIHQTSVSGEATTSWEYLLTEGGVWPCRVRSIRLTANKVLSCIGVKPSEVSRTEEVGLSVLPLTYKCECYGSGWRSVRKEGRISSSRCLASKHTPTLAYTSQRNI